MRRAPRLLTPNCRAAVRRLEERAAATAAQFEALATDYPSPIPVGPTLPRTCLTLPETPLRIAAFRDQNPPGYLIWPGLKASPGWRGAALSYRHIMRRQRKNACGGA